MIRKHSNQDSLAYKALMPIVKKAAVSQEFPAKLEVYGAGNAMVVGMGYPFSLGLSVAIGGTTTDIRLPPTGDFLELYEAVKANPRV